MLEDTGKLTEVGRVWGARRIASVACLYGEDKGLESLYVNYSGRDADKAFEKDFEQFSRFRPLIKQEGTCCSTFRFGYNDGHYTPPAPIFYDALVPVIHIFERSGFSGLFGVVSIADDTADFGDLWVDPRTGALRKGPYVGYSFNRTFTAAGFEENVAARGEHHLLPIHAYSDSVFTYLTSVLSTKILVQGINLSSRGSLERVPTEDAVTRLTLLPGTVYIRSCRMVVAKRPGDVKGWYYSLQCVRGVPDAMHQVRMDDSSLRTEFYYELHPVIEWHSFVESWLLQAHRAHSMLNRHGLQEDGWKEFSVLDGFWLELCCINEEISRKSTNKSAYLFIRPNPKPSDYETIWSSWAKQERYFWSLDPFGHEKMAEDVRVSLGPPSRSA
uniref:Uncharacterized protein n=1 Tax=Moniliophthora roreri TaxID=221103 RepID=A0A0W0F3G0_MONRR